MAGVVAVKSDLVLGDPENVFASSVMELPLCGYNLPLNSAQDVNEKNLCIEMVCPMMLEFLPDVDEAVSAIDYLSFPRDDDNDVQHTNGALVTKEAVCLSNLGVVCQSCGKGCRGSVELEQHAELHDCNVRVYGCGLCKVQFDDSSLLISHVQHHVHDLHVYSTCGCDGARQSVLQSDNRQICGICGENFRIVREFQISASEISASNGCSEVRDGDKIQLIDDQSLGDFDTNAERFVSGNLHHPENQPVKKVMSLAEPSSHSCIVCSETFTSHATLFRHSLIHPLIHIAELGLPSCGICKSVFPDAAELHKHVQHEAGLHASVCDNSSCETDLPGNLILAVLQNALIVKSEAEDGVASFSVATANIFADNLVQNLEQPNQTCTVADENLSKEIITGKADFKKSTADATYVCSQCCRSFLNVQGLLCHMKMHAEGKPYKCVHCGDSFRFPKRLAIHARVFHDILLCEKCGNQGCSCSVEEAKSENHKSDAKNSKNGFRCLRCNRVFARMKALQKHEMTHVQGIVHICDICGKNFSDRSQFSRHLALHNGVRHQCDVCQKAFSSDVILRDHMKTHSSDRPLTCNFCGKHFKWRNALRVHLNKHYGSTYQCYICGRDFTTKAYLMTHVEMHTGPRVRSHKCNLCDKAYFDKSALRKHRMTHVEVRSRPFECHICGKSFLANNNLQTHLKLHKNERPYRCDTCGKSFNMKGHLKRHTSIHNKNDANHVRRASPVILHTDDFPQETCEEVVIDSVVTVT